MPSFEAKTFMPATPDAVFEFLDTPAKAGGHMEKPSMMMIGGSMTYETDARGGREVGSVITMGGNFLWLRLSVRETVVEREPPRRKVWETQGAQQLLIMERYRMGLDIKPDGQGSALSVWIDYDLPPSGFWRLAGYLVAPVYARWCVGRMAGDASRSHGGTPAVIGPRPQA